MTGTPAKIPWHTQGLVSFALCLYENWRFLIETQLTHVNLESVFHFLALTHGPAL